MIDRGRFNVLGIGVSAVDYDAAVARIVTAAKAGEPMGISALAVHGVMTGVLDREHCYRLNQLEMIVPDGQPVRWALNWLHRAQLKDRVYGPNLTLRVCEAAAENDLPIFLFGSSAEVLDKLSDKLCEKFPKLRIAGKQPSRFRRLSESERDELAKQIIESGARITMVGIGCPRQEIWAYELKRTLSMPVLAVGAAFAFHSGELAQAPQWMQDRGLEWFYRLTREPLRLWKRYALLNPTYAALIGLQALRLMTLTPARGREPKEEQRYG